MMGPGFFTHVGAGDVELAARFALVCFAIGLVAGFALGAWLV